MKVYRKGVCDMRQSFDELWEAMEDRRQQAEWGGVAPTPDFGRIRQGQRQGCPDEEALCGWVDGELRRHSLRRWMTMWRHVRIGRCRGCQAEAEAIAEAMPPTRPQWSRVVPTVKGAVAPLRMRRTPLAWASSMLVVVVGLSLWSFGTHSTFREGLQQTGAPPITEVRTPPAGEEIGLEAQPEQIIWGD